MSNSSLLSVKEVIDNTFGDHEKNTVNFKLLQTVLYLLAKQLRLLERRVHVTGIPLKPVPSVSSLTVTEIKIQASITKPRKSVSKSDGEKTATDKGKTVRRVTTTKDDELSGPSGMRNVEYRSVDSLEERQERVLRIINQRADSREEPDLDPKPMASITSSAKVQQEKLFVVERVPSVQAVSESVHLSVVTQEQFNELAAAVKVLQDLLKSGNVPGFPENAQLMEELRNGASLTDAMAALQLSARLEAAEKALENMTSIITELAKKIPEISIDITDDGSDIKYQKRKSIKPSRESVAMIKDVSKKEGETHFQEPFVTKNEFENSIKDLYDNVMETITAINKRSRENAEATLEATKNLEKKLAEAMELGDRMEECEAIVNEYASQINSMDTELSAQMTSYQEQLTQMQYDLDAGLEAMTEAVSTAEGDPAAVAELSGKLTSIHIDIEHANLVQKELEEMQRHFTTDLENLWKHLEILRETKSDREEVEDALRDKAGLSDLNGRVTKEEFEAVREYYEKRIKAAYSKFDNQELVWQKIIEDLVREINEKSDWVQTAALRDDINKHLQRLNNMVQALSDIVGEPRAAIISRKLIGNGQCLSCSKPAYMDAEEPDLMPKLPSFPKSKGPITVAADNNNNTPKGDGDHKLCYPGQPMPHLRDPRSYFCHRFCGGKHTTVTGVDRSLPGVVTKPLQRNIVTGIGSDGKAYLLDDLQERKPCEPCNKTNDEDVEPRKSISDHACISVLKADERASELVTSYVAPAHSPDSMIDSALVNSINDSAMPGALGSSLELLLS